MAHCQGARCPMLGEELNSRNRTPLAQTTTVPLRTMAVLIKRNVSKTECFMKTQYRQVLQGGLRENLEACKEGKNQGLGCGGHCCLSFLKVFALNCLKPSI